MIWTYVPTLTIYVKEIIMKEDGEGLRSSWSHFSTGISKTHLFLVRPMSFLHLSPLYTRFVAALTPFIVRCIAASRCEAFLCISAVWRSFRARIVTIICTIQLSTKTVFCLTFSSLMNGGSYPLKAVLNTSHYQLLLLSTKELLLKI